MIPALKLDDVAACVERREKAVAFPATIELVYQAETRSYRAKALRTSILPAMLIYNTFLPVDAFLLPRTIWLAASLHLAVTLWILWVGHVLRAAPSWRLRECLAVSIPILIIAQILAIYSINQGAVAEHYQYLVIAIIIYMNVNLRPAFGYALTASLVLGSSYSAALFVTGASMPSLIVGIGFMAAAMHLTLMANWRMERDVRHAFLRRLLDRLRCEAAEAEAARDALTGLANRRRLDEVAAELWRGDTSSTSCVAVILLDVDHFKAFNDRYGHLAGDQCLKRVASALDATSRDASGSGNSLAVRFGGEEFLLLLPGTDLATAQRAAEHVRCTVEGLTIQHEGQSCSSVTVSLGVAAGPIATSDLSALIACADTALYTAKRAGRNQVWPPVTTPATVRDAKRAA